jgi:hypothetical protein
MEGFEQYVVHLEAAAQAALNGQDDLLQQLDFTAVLNGAVGAELRQHVALTELQARGAFFTGPNLRDVALQAVGQDLAEFSVSDPACGAGDLLLGVAESLPLYEDLEQTLADWARQIHGRDIEPLFVRATRARLVLAAYHRGARALGEAGLNLTAVLPELRVADMLSEMEALPVTSHTVLNPPFIQVVAPATCEWGSGKISGAGLFLERCLRQARAGSRIVAILPDVLRSGSRYEDWRRMVERLSTMQRIEVYGPFDPRADIDVFVLDLLVRQDPLETLERVDPRWQLAAPATHTLGDLFDVSTGAVVPHRHEETGDEFQYLHTRNATPWATLNQVEERRRFSGTVVRPPMVVIRRTSSPSDRERPVGTIVLGAEPVAVENHLLILKPKSGGEELCKYALSVLQSAATRSWIDQRIRTRHLTVQAIRDIPWILPA